MAHGSNNTTTTPSLDVQAVGIAASAYAKRSGDLMTLIDDLRKSGAALDVPLPRIVVIGNQSAGKSSLVQAISAIKAPRDEGTCTRAPFEVRLRHSAHPWSCRVSIRFETDELGGALPVVREVPFGPAVTEPAKVEGVLRRAQLAIVNPSISMDSLEGFVKLKSAAVTAAKQGQPPLGSIEQLSFSRNPVVVDISGPNLTNLTFLDLPGIISNGPEKDVKLIEDLVKTSIEGNSLILLTLNMRDDLDCQSAAGHAQRADPKGRRTIGVLTKADAVLAGEHARWIDILNGKAHALHRGYYATKQPGVAELATNPSFEEARVAEEAFFSKEEPWSSLPHSIKKRLGTPNLTVSLSELLSNQIAEQLPMIQRTITTSLATTIKELSALPPPPSAEPFSELLGLIRSLERDAEALSLGSQGSETLIQTKNLIDKVFFDKVCATRPCFIPFDRSKDAEKAEQFIKDDLKSLEEEWKAGSEIDVGISTEGLAEPQLVVDDERLVMDLTDVRKHITLRKTRELPLNTPYAAKTALMTEASKPWRLITLLSLEDMRLPIMDSMLALVGKHFGRYEESGLLSLVASTVIDEVERLFAECKARLEHLLQLEQTPFTLNKHYYSTTREQTNALYKKLRNTSVFDGLIDEETKRTVLSGLVTLGFSGVKGDDLSKLYPDDEFATELDTMAHTMANFKVAYKRLIDNAPRIVDHDIIRRLPMVISNALFDKVSPGGREGANLLLQESLEVMKIREELTSKEKRLLKGKAVLDKYRMLMPPIA